MVILWYKILLEHCKVNISDNKILIKIKSIVKQKILSKFKVKNLHKFAMFFDLRMKQLKVLKLSDILWVKIQIKSQCANLLVQFDNESDNSINTIQERPKNYIKKQIKIL